MVYYHTGPDKYSFALASNGTAWAWGRNDYGQLGDGTKTDRHTPVQITSLSNILKISASVSHSLALAEDGTVWAWGYNANGQLGQETNNDFIQPNPLYVGLQKMVSIAAGSAHSLALAEDGTVWAWGANNAGQLGNGTTTDSYFPTEIATLSNIIKIAARYEHSLALAEDGTVWAWGANNEGQLGDGSTSNHLTPVQVASLSNIISITAGDLHSLALAEDGTVWTWGDNAAGQLGDCTDTDKYSPVKVAGLSGVPSCPLLTLSVVHNGNGAVNLNPPDTDCTGSCSKSYSFGTEVTLTATSDSDSVFVGWSEESCLGTVPCTVTVDQSKSITASFELKTDDITAENYQFGNVDPRSDRFSVWMDVSVNGKKPDNFCEEYTLSVEGDNGKGAKQGDDEGQISCRTVPNNSKTPVTAQRYRVDFEIDKDGAYPTAAYFENGKIIVQNSSTGAETELSGLSDFSIYGTTFNLKEDAWSFANADWHYAKGDVEDYRKIIANEIDEKDERDTKIGGSQTREDFNAHVGFKELNISLYGIFKHHYSTGLCYGLASSAVTNFVWKDKLFTWGRGNANNWKNEIDTHWDTDNNIAKSPFKPFLNIHALTWDDSAKIIMYYFAAQSSLLNSSETNSANWVGKDDYRLFNSIADSSGELILLDSLLKKERPILTDIPDHEIVLLQLSRWSENSNGKIVYMFWDNNHPYNEDDKNGPYAEWHINDQDGGYKSSSNEIRMINNEDNSETEVLRTITNIEEIKFMFPCINGIKDSQNIYNLWNEPCLELPVPATAASAAKSAEAQTSATATSYGAPDHIEVMFIGGTINGIYNQATDEKINPVFSDSLQPGQAAIQSTMGGTYHLIHLPADTSYRVEATKAADMPYAEVYATIPNTDGTVEKLYYDNIGFSETDATKFSFTVGRGNSDRVVHRTGGSDKTPDYDISLDMAVTPPSGFAGFAAGGQVQLSWENSSHPKLSLVKIVRKQDGFPASHSDGTEVYSGLAETATDSTAVSNTLYYYAAFSMDSSGNYSDSATAAVDTAHFAVTGLVTNSGAGLANAKVEIRNSDQFPVAMTYTRADGSYVLANLDNDSYTVEASAFGCSMDSSPQAVTVSNANQTADFTSAAVPTLGLVFDIDTLQVGTQAQIAWKYLNIDNSETLLVQKIAGETVTKLAELPASSNYFLWKVDGPVNQTVIIKVSLKSNPDVSVQDELKILPASSSNHGFLPAINLLLRNRR